MTKFAHLLLILTSLAPVGFVQAVVSFERHQRRVSLYLAIAVVALVAICVLLLWGLGRFAADVPKEIKDPVPKGSEPLAFLVAYALPLVSARSDAPGSWGLAAFALVMALAVWQQQLFHINPLLAILGYQFHVAKTDGGAQVTIVSRTRFLGTCTARVVRISDNIWFLKKS